MGRGLRGVPLVPDAEALLDLGFGRAKKAAQRVDEANSKKRSRVQLQRMIQTSSDVMYEHLKNWVRAWPSLDQMTPFLRSLTNAAVGENEYRKHLGALDWASRSIRSIGRDTAAQFRQCSDLESAHSIRRQAYGRIASVVYKIADDLEWLRKAHGILSELPSLDDENRCVVIAGAPNVGKSALIASLSKATPEVAAYPFTTKRLHLGHFIHRRQPVQLIDTPGLLDRPDPERNSIEKQALSALDYACDLALFLFDPTETCGFDQETQYHVLQQVLEHLGSTPVWIIEGKADLWHPENEQWHNLIEQEEKIRLLQQETTDKEAWVPPYIPKPLPGEWQSDHTISTIKNVGVDTLRWSIGKHLSTISNSDALNLPEGWHRLQQPTGTDRTDISFENQFI